MSDTVTLEAVARDIKIIRKQLAKPETKTWVSVAVIKDVTGRDGREFFRMLRDNNLVQYDSKKGYLLESLHPLYIKQPINTNATAATNAN